MNKTFSVFFSVFLHSILLFFIFFYSLQKQDSLWSGGHDGVYNVTYVELGDLNLSPFAGEGGQRPGQGEKRHGQSGTGTSTTPVGGKGAGLDKDGIVSNEAPNILALIRKKIMEQKTFPSLARENKWTGEVKVQFKIDESGDIEFIDVVESSGFEILDKAAVKSIQRAAPFPFYAQTIALALEYRLEE